MIGYIVEGLNDRLAVERVRKQVRCVVLRGTRFTNRTRMDIEACLKDCEKIFLLTDPDEPGDHMASVIQKEYPFIPRITIDPEKAKGLRGFRWKTGVEHCSPDYLDSVLPKEE